MHILLLNDDALPASKGGAAVLVEHVRRAFASAGHRVTLLTTHRDAEAESRREDDAGMIIGVRSVYPAARRARRSVSETEVTKRIGELMRELKPDVVHAHNIHEHVGYPTLLNAKEVTDKIFLTAHDTFLVSYDRVGGRRYREAVARNEAYRLPLHENIMKAGRKYWPPRNGRIKKILRESGTKIVTYSQSMKNFLEGNGICVDASVHGGTPAMPQPDAEFCEQWKRQKNVDGPCVLFGARISEDKGITALLRAGEEVIKSIPNVVFLIAGEEKRLQPFLTGISDAMRARIRMTGWIPHEEMAYAYASADIVTSPSVYLDNFPTVNLEAMAMGKPVVGTCFGGTPEAVKDDETGIIVDPVDTTAFAQALTKLLQDPKLAQEMGAAGKKRVADVFSMEKQVREYLALYAS